jgi:hypothetical protein
VAKCAEWLRRFLGDFAFPSTEILEAAKKAGFTLDNAAKAKKLLKESGLQNSNLGRLRGVWWSGFGEPKEWKLRPEPPSNPPHKTPNSPNTHYSPKSHNIGKPRDSQCCETCETQETSESGASSGQVADRLFEDDIRGLPD